MFNYDLNVDVNKTPPNPEHLTMGQVRRYGRKSNKEGRVQTSLEQQETSTRITCERYGLPTTDADIRSEPIGAKGDWWWDSGGFNGLDEPDPNRKTRKVLTALLHECRDQKCKAIVVFNLDRLFRDVSIAQELIMFLYRNNILLYDFDGPCNIWTHQGRNAILQNAISSAALSANSRINSPRGVRESIRQGKLVVSPNVLGMRSAGQRSGQVIHLDEEQVLVNRIYRMSDGGMSTLQIADTLELEHVRLYESTEGVNPHGSKRTETNKNKIRMGTVRDILRDCRYIGLQKWNGETYPCKVLLRKVERDGQIIEETIVPRDLWERVQQKLDGQKRTGNASVNKNALAGLVRCGVDGTVLNNQECPSKGGTHYWIIKSTNRVRDGQAKSTGNRYLINGPESIDQPIGTCSHRLPSIRAEVLDNYIADVFGPLMAKELSDRFQDDRGRAFEAIRTQVEQAIHEKERFRREELYKFATEKGCSPLLVAQMENGVITAIEDLHRQLDDIIRQQGTLAKAPQALADLRSIDQGQRRDLVRQCICWVAVFADPSEREPKKNYKCAGYTYAPTRLGKLVILTSWGTYHTVLISRERRKNAKGNPPFILTPAPVEDVIGGVLEFPNPQSFYLGLKNAWEGRVYKWTPEQFAPGYSSSTMTEIPEFELTTGTQITEGDIKKAA